MNKVWLASAAFLCATVGVAWTADARARGYAFLRDTQLRDELADRRAQDRDVLDGGWCFSDGVHRWAVAAECKPLESVAKPLASIE